jgi:hypothetical protein
MENLIGHVIKYYEVFFSSVSGRKAYEFRPKETQIKQIRNFLKLLDQKVGLSSIDEQFIFDFIAFQFDKRKDLKTRFGVGIIPLNHAIGKKAYESWERKSDNWYYWVGVLLKNHNIERPLEGAIDNKGWVLRDLYKHEESIKEQFMGSRELLFHCSELTTLYNKSSEFCRICAFSKDCQELQKSIYPKFYED